MGTAPIALNPEQTRVSCVLASRETCRGSGVSGLIPMHRPNIPAPDPARTWAPGAQPASSAGAALQPVEGNAAIAKRDPGVVTDDEMVEQVDVEETASCQSLGCQVEIVGRRRRVT